MRDPKRWAVTYTKHIMQKRKVYQDGALELHHPNDKVVLFDDGGKILETKFLKKDEVVQSGGTLTFDAYLVDIGDIEGNSISLTDLNVGLQSKGSIVPQRQKATYGASAESKRTELLKHQTTQVRGTVAENSAKAQGSCEDLSKIEHHKRLRSRLHHSIDLKNQDSQQRMRYSLCGSSQKQVMLYDDSGKLLSSRFLKKDEVVDSGRTLTFDAHLVEVGDLKDNFKPLMDLNILIQDEALKTEWHALYTTQLTQKSKKYHDGILKVTFRGFSGKQVACLNEDGTILPKPIQSSENVSGHSFQAANNLVHSGKPQICQGDKAGNLLHHLIDSKGQELSQVCLEASLSGSNQNQKKVMLYDDSGKLLTSRFLKKDEVVDSGGTVTFGGHLVEVGDLKGNSKPLVDLDDQRRAEKSFISGMQCKNARHSSSVGSSQNFLEWHALYTTQITQKAKKYHDGILKLMLCGTYNEQVVWLYEDGTTLCSKHMQSFENVSGNEFQTTNNLGHVGKIQTSQGEELQNDVSSSEVVDSKASSLNPNKLIGSGRARLNKPLRDASEILSVLKNPVAQENPLSRKLTAVITHPSQHSDSRHLVGPEKNAEYNFGDDSEICKSQSVPLQFKGAPDIHASGLNKLYLDFKVKLMKDYSSTSSDLLHGVVQSETSAPKPDMGCSIEHLDVLATASQVPEVIKRSPVNGQVNGQPESALNSTSYDDTISEESCMLCEPSSNCDQMSKINQEYANQPRADRVEKGKRRSEESLPLGGISTSEASVVEGEKAEECKSLRVDVMDVDSIPSFDLGF